jgi:FkbH-like protein
MPAMTMDPAGPAIEMEPQPSGLLSPGEQLAALAAWVRSNASPEAAAMQTMCLQAAALAQNCAWSETATTLADHPLAGARWLAASLYEGGRDFNASAAVLDTFSCAYSRPAEAARLLALARVLLLAGRAVEAVSPLRRSIRLSESYRSLTAAGKLLRALEKADAAPFARECRLAMLGNATFDFILPVLKTVAFAGGIRLVPFSGAYNQQMQEALDSGSALHAFGAEVVILATDWRWLALDEEVADPDGLLAEKLQEIEQMWNAIASQLRCHIVQHNFVVPEVSAYCALSGRLRRGRANLIRRLNLELAERAARRTDITVLDVDEIASLIGKRAWDDPRMWIAAKQYPAAEAIGLLAAHQVALLRSLLGLSAKCLVLDLDNTLWGGVVGEDGLDGIRLGGSAEGEAFLEFQRYVKGLRDRGVILAVCSKNNDADARLPFLEHPEMVLRLEDIAVFIANWQPKADNLRAIAAQLNLGIESMVLVDDNPVEREQVRRELPKIEVPEMPSDPALFAQALHRELAFETLSITSEDIGRAQSYRANLDRERLQQSAASLDDFLSGLQMRVELRPFDEPNLPRIAQLINKTNQFNLTTRRMTAEQIRAFAAIEGNYTQFLHLRDRFGESGITGVLMASPQSGALGIVQWLMSCRVLGRRLEEAMLASVWNAARRSGLRALVGTYIPTAKNGQVEDLYDRMGFALLGLAENGEKTYRAELTTERVPPHFISIDDLTATARAT